LKRITLRYGYDATFPRGGVAQLAEARRLNRLQ
jgi:hypothetical protein